MNLSEVISATRGGAGLFVMEGRALLEVRGEDRVRWLDGMISGDVEALASTDSPSGCYAMLLTNRGAIVADLHVGRFGDVFVLESRRDQLDKILESLDRFIIADDVALIDLRAEFEALGIEGPRAAEILAAVTGASVDLEPESWAEFDVDGRAIRVGAFGFTGEVAFQIHVSRVDRPAVERAIEAAGAAFGMVRGSPDALEVMRVEAGIPALGSELNEEILPAEARLERAISTSKGCYVGQEIVARLRSRGQVNHLLVGFEVEAGDPSTPATSVLVGGRRTGEITSFVRSPSLGPIALGFVRREHADVGTRVEFEGGAAHVAALPFLSDLSRGHSI